tara:strand:+ start:364 stop:876 length:513 start_codon:yes stop_codon:yes gene_type:complete
MSLLDFEIQLQINNFMNQFKKRVRIYVEKLGFEVVYLYNGGLCVRNKNSSIVFTPLSKAVMSCQVARQQEEFQFQIDKTFVFDIIDRFARGRSLSKYSPKGKPLTLQEYIDEEGSAFEIRMLHDQVKNGTAENGELGGNHYIAEYHQGILIIYDDLMNAPTNVICASDMK